MAATADDRVIAESELGVDLSGTEVHTLGKLMDVKQLVNSQVEELTNHIVKHHGRY